MDGALETVGWRVFAESELEVFVAPRSLCYIGPLAFSGCDALRHADLSACLSDLLNDRGDLISARAFENSGLESVRLPRTLSNIGTRAFYNCKNIKSIAFYNDPEQNEQDSSASNTSVPESFVAPPHLRKIGDLAFGNCPALKDFRVNETIWELGWLCL